MENGTNHSGMASLVAAAAAAVPLRTAAQGSGGPTYHGFIASTQDCLLLFEACRVGVCRRIQRRLSEQEREKAIRSGSVFVWEESESGIKRWTDSKSWSPSRIKGSFLVYREVDEETARRRASSYDSDDGASHRPNSSNPRRLSNASSSASMNSQHHQHQQQQQQQQASPHVPLLTKKSISVRTKEGGKLHVVCYYTKSDVSSGRLQTPRQDPALQSLAIRAGLYPEILPEVSLGPPANNSNQHQPSLSPQPGTPELALRMRASFSSSGVSLDSGMDDSAVGSSRRGSLASNPAAGENGIYPVSASAAARAQEMQRQQQQQRAFEQRVEEYTFPDNGSSSRRMSTDQAAAVVAAAAAAAAAASGAAGGRAAGGQATYLERGRRGSASTGSGGEQYPAPIVTGGTRGQYRAHPYARPTPASATFPGSRQQQQQQQQTGYSHQQQQHQLPTPTSAQYGPPLEFSDVPYYRQVYGAQGLSSALPPGPPPPTPATPAAAVQSKRGMVPSQLSPIQLQNANSLAEDSSGAAGDGSMQAAKQQQAMSPLDGQQGELQRLPPLRLAVGRMEDNSRWDEL
ncbi:hypothetical protein HDU90_006471 [Geranomyces variabilis]|nr:hypothetical protein HDU90_006471 [Geranomyces variabilis]